MFYYYGNANEAIKNDHVFRTSFNEVVGLGNAIRQKQSELEKTNNLTKKELIVLLKPSKECSYKNLVNALDEMLINWRN